MLQRKFQYKRIHTVILSAVFVGSLFSFASPRYVSAGSGLRVNHTQQSAQHMPCQASGCTKAVDCRDHCYEKGDRDNKFVILPSALTKGASSADCVVAFSGKLIIFTADYIFCEPQELLNGVYFLKSIIKLE